MGVQVLVVVSVVMVVLAVVVTGGGPWWCVGVGDGVGIGCLRYQGPVQVRPGFDPRTSLNMSRPLALPKGAGPATWRPGPWPLRSRPGPPVGQGPLALPVDSLGLPVTQTRTGCCTRAMPYVHPLVRTQRRGWI